MKILLCEDDLSLLDVLKRRLTSSGYIVETANNGLIGLDLIETNKFDLIISDIMMPKLDGLEMLKKIRARGDKTPVLLLTAKDKTEDIVLGLDSGADDYMVKPFSYSELLARIRVLTRRTLGVKDNKITVQDLTIDLLTREVERAGKKINLSFKEFELLMLLVKNKNIVLSREKIIDAIYKFDSYIESNAIDVFIRYLRKKIDDDFKVKLIHTVRGVGYVVKDNERK